MTLKTPPSSDQVTFIIPAAGYGKRYGSPCSKELMPHPDGGGSYLEVAMALVRGAQGRAVIISRTDKHDLNQVVERWMKEDGVLDVVLYKVEKTREWADSVVQSQHFWGEFNILLLPDTVFRPLSILQQIKQSLLQDEVVLATFAVDQPQLWGVVESGPQGTWLIEKPAYSDSNRAWGLIGFHRHVGVALFEALGHVKPDKRRFLLTGSHRLLDLTEFRDETRKTYTIS